jgi:hypothetical protein
MQIFRSRFVGDESRVSAIEYCDLVWVNLEEVQKNPDCNDRREQREEIKASVIDPLSVTHGRV